MKRFVGLFAALPEGTSKWFESLYQTVFYDSIIQSRNGDVRSYCFGGCITPVEKFLNRREAHWKPPFLTKFSAQTWRQNYMIKIIMCLIQCTICRYLIICQWQKVHYTPVYYGKYFNFYIGPISSDWCIRNVKNELSNAAEWKREVRSSGAWGDLLFNGNFV